MHVVELIIRNNFICSRERYSLYLESCTYKKASIMSTYQERREDAYNSGRYLGKGGLLTRAKYATVSVMLAVESTAIHTLSNRLHPVSSLSPSNFISYLFRCVKQYQGVGAGIAYGVFQWAYYPDKFAFAHKNTITVGPSRGFAYLNSTMFRPAVYFSAIGITYSTVEHLMTDIFSGGHRQPRDSAAAGFAAGIVMGGFLSRRFGTSIMTALGTSIVMGCLEMNGPTVMNDPVTENARNRPATVQTKYQESEDLAALKEKYPAYKYN